MAVTTIVWARIQLFPRSIRENTVARLTKSTNLLTSFEYPQKSLLNRAKDPYYPRLARSIGLGYASVRHAREIGQTYDSDLLPLLRRNPNLSPVYHLSTQRNARSCCTKENHLRSAAERGLHERAVQAGLALPCKISYVQLPLLLEKKVEWVDWPVLLPYDMVPCFQLVVSLDHVGWLQYT